MNLFNQLQEKISDLLKKNKKREAFSNFLLTFQIQYEHFPESRYSYQVMLF